MDANEFKRPLAYPVCFFVPFVLFVAKNIDDVFLAQKRQGAEEENIAVIF